MLDAASLAAILDPERKVLGWWTTCWTSPDFGGTPVDELPAVCKFNDWHFTGPPDLHTAREHCWRKEEWLEARNIGWIRHVANDLSAVTCVMLGTSSVHPDNVCNPNHAAALNAAIERIVNND